MDTATSAPAPPRPAPHDPEREPLFRARELTKVYPSGETEIRALDGVDLDLFESELIVYEESARMLTAGTQIMEVGDPTDMEAEIELLSSDAVGVQPGADASIEEWGGDAPLRGKVSVVEPGGYTKVSSFGVEEQRVKVRVDFVDPLPAGMVMGDRFRVEARIVTWHADNVLQVPMGALFRRGGDWMTFVLEGGQARPVRVEIAHNNGSAAEVRSGLTEGQRVIVHPPDAIADGSAVKPRRESGR